MPIPIVPQFLMFVIEAPGQIIGLIEGIIEGTSAHLRVRAGYLADKLGRPKLLIVVGYCFVFGITTCSVGKERCAQGAERIDRGKMNGGQEAAR